MGWRFVMTEAFKDRKLVVVGGSSGMGRQTAANVVAGGGSAVIIGRKQDRVDETRRERVWPGMEPDGHEHRVLAYAGTVRARVDLDDERRRHQPAPTDDRSRREGPGVEPRGYPHRLHACRCDRLPSVDHASRGRW